MEAMVTDILAGVEACRKECGLLLALRRRRTRQQTVRERHVRQHADLILQPHPDHAGQSHSLGASTRWKSAWPARISLHRSVHNSN